MLFLASFSKANLTFSKIVMIVGRLGRSAGTGRVMRARQRVSLYVSVNSSVEQTVHELIK